MASIVSPTNAYNWLPSGNPIVFTLSTTNVWPQLSYIIDVYVNGTMVAQLKYPVYDRNRMDIDLRSIVNDYLTDTFVNDEILSPSNTLVYPANETASLHIEVWEEWYNTVQQQWQRSKQPEITKNIYIWRAAAEFEDARHIWRYQDYFTWETTNDDPKFLGPKVNGFDFCNEVETTLYRANLPFFTNRYKVSMNSLGTVSFFTYGLISVNPGDITDFVEVWCYDSMGNRTKTFRWNNPEHSNYTLADYTRRISQFPCTPRNLNQVPWSSITLQAGTLNYIDPSEDKYYVIFTHEGWGQGGGYEWGIRAIPFEIVCDSDCKWPVYNILYKTREGGWWQIRADRKSFNETKVETSVKYNTWGTGAMEPVPNSKRFKETMHTNADGTITLNTDWISSQYFIEEIEDMIVSPQIYLVKEGATPQYIPVVLKDSTHKIWNVRQDKLIQYEFEFEEAFKKATLL